MENPKAINGSVYPYQKRFPGEPLPFNQEPKMGLYLDESRTVNVFFCLFRRNFFNEPDQKESKSSLELHEHI